MRKTTGYKFIPLLSIIPWDASSTENMLGYSGEIIDDLSSPLTAIIGVLLGLIVFEVVIGVIRGRH